MTNTLFRPEPEDIAAIESDLASLAGDRAAPAGPGTVFAGGAAAKLERLRGELAPLAGRYDVVVANPPYMGSSNMDRWLAGWTKESYPDSKRDLCTCFIERGFDMLDPLGYSAMVTMESWMFLGSFEQLRKRILAEHSIATLVYMNHMVMRIAFNTSATVFRNERSDAAGIYTQVYYEDLDDNGTPKSFPSRRKGVAPAAGDADDRAGALEALADPGCGWFYRRDAEAFGAIPSSPIAYWASSSMRKSFVRGQPLGAIAEPKQGMVTRDNQRFMRSWWEIGKSKMALDIQSHGDARQRCDYKWVPCTSGGPYRKWYGNNVDVVNWENDGEELIMYSGSHIKNREYYFREAVTWTAISSSRLSTRFVPTGFVPEHAGNCLFGSSEDLVILQAICNSSLCLSTLMIISPTLNFNVGDLIKIPVLDLGESKERVIECVAKCRRGSQCDWDAYEASWDYKRHPMR